MQVTVTFYSYLKDLTGCVRLTESVPEGSTLGELLSVLTARYPRLHQMQKSILMAVGVDYQHRGYRLKESDEVSLFPPVQGG